MTFKVLVACSVCVLWNTRKQLDLQRAFESSSSNTVSVFVCSAPVSLSEVDLWYDVTLTKAIAVSVANGLHHMVTECLCERNAFCFSSRDILVPIHLPFISIHLLHIYLCILFMSPFCALNPHPLRSYSRRKQCEVVLATVLHRFHSDCMQTGRACTLPACSARIKPRHITIYGVNTTA